ncbi:MAG TPA: ribbon-helix-helix domain-containing protein [Kofleriaceae bacterium]
MTPGDDDDDDDEGPIDEVAAAAALRRLDALIAKHPELVGPTGPDNVSAWMETLKSIEEGTDMAKEPTTQVAFRLPDSLIARLDRHVERMGKEHPGLDFSRADAVRSLLTRALDEIEGSSAPTKRGGR